MARRNIGVEAYGKYLNYKNLASALVTSKWSDDEVIAFFNKAVSEANLRHDADKFVHDWCMTFK